MAGNFGRRVYRQCWLSTANNGTACINLSYKKYRYLRFYLQEIVVFGEQWGCKPESLLTSFRLCVMGFGARHVSWPHCELCSHLELHRAPTWQSLPGVVQGISNSCVSTTLGTSPASSEQLTGDGTALVQLYPGHPWQEPWGHAVPTGPRLAGSGSTGSWRDTVMGTRHKRGSGTGGIGVLKPIWQWSKHTCFLSAFCFPVPPVTSSP